MKAQQIGFCIQKIQEILNYLDPERNWGIVYYFVAEKKDIDAMFSPYEIQRFHICLGDEYFLIYDKDGLLYAVNVTGDSVLTALEELMLMLSKKF